MGCRFSEAIRRWRRLELAAVVLVMLGAFAMDSTVSVARSTASRTSKARYTVTYTIAKGSYGTTSSSNIGSDSESDNFTGAAHYQFAMPKAGSVPNLKHASSHETIGPDETNVPAFENTDSSGTDCIGDLESDLTLPPLLKGRQSGQSIVFTVELAMRVLIEHAHPRHGSFNCASIYNDTDAFQSAYAHYMPRMLEAKLSVRLSALRGMKVGAKRSFHVTASDNAVALPPHDCTAYGVQCTQQLGWQGEVSFSRDR